MAKSTDVVILGAGFRGLWLAAELVKLGWKVHWIQLHAPESHPRASEFVFDDWPLQIGPFRKESKFIPLVQEFVEKVIAPASQEIAVQVMTPQGPLELSGGGELLALKKFFPKSWGELDAYFKCIHQSRRMEDHKGQKLLFAHTKKIFERPLSERWILEWLGSLRRSRSVATREWILNWSKDVLDPADPLWLLNDGLEAICQRGIQWAREKGVVVYSRNAVADVSVDGRFAKGIEITGGEGFMEMRFLIAACSHQKIMQKVPSLGREIESKILPQSEKWAWIRCGFLLKAGSKPEGLLEFSSFVIDPFMPLVEGNAGFLKWKSGEKNDHLTVWVKVPYGELKRRSYLMNLTEEIQANLDKLFPRFSKILGAVSPFEEYFHSPEVGHDDLAIVFDEANDFSSLKTKLHNVWMAGPGQDRGLEVLSALATEYRLLREMTEIRQKELKKSDRKIHPARDGRNLDRTK